MIQITDKSLCCGCEACVQACPKRCITLQEDAEGFAYPVVDTATCVDCHVCETVCPLLHAGQPRKPRQVVAAINRNEAVRMESSSGGVFTLLAEQVISRGGAVFGVGFDAQWMPAFSYVESADDLARFRGSKYVQARVGTAFADARRLLQAGREVLFSGTPCQIAALRRFLRKPYPNLHTVDFICHGVPSPGLWRRYLQEEVTRLGGKNTVSGASGSAPEADALSRVEAIRFRDKADGWQKFSFALRLSATNGSGQNSVSLCVNANRNPFEKGFLCNLYLRPSCHQCRFREGRSGADLTLSDLWGANAICPDLNDNKGLSALYVYDTRLTAQIAQGGGKCAIFRLTRPWRTIPHGASRCRCARPGSGFSRRWPERRTARSFRSSCATRPTHSPSGS